MTEPTPTLDPYTPRRFADFGTLVDALDYAARGTRGVNLYSARGELTAALTYAQVRDRAEDIGRRLVELGLEKGTRLALIAETSADFICFFLGCQYASVLPVPLPLPTSFGGRDGYVSQLTLQMKSCKASAVIAPAHMIDLVRQADRELDLTFVGTPEDFRELPLGGGDLRLPTADDIAYLQYSSGSTRFPHGVVVTHRSLLANCHGMGKYGVQLQDDDRCASWLPFYHDMGLVGTFLTALTCQVTADFLATEDFARRPLTWLSIISANRNTITYSPTFGYDICSRRARAEAVKALDLSCIKVAGIGGDMIRPDVMRTFAETFAPAGYDAGAFLPSYGLAECTLAVSFAPRGSGIAVDSVDERILAGDFKVGQPAHGHHGRNGHNGHNGHTNGHRSTLNGIHVNGVNGHGLNGVNGHARLRDVVNCGAPLPGYEVDIRDEDDACLAERAVGRVFVRGTSVMRGYFDDPVATRQVLSPDGWLDTGDMGYMLDGCLYIVGRAKDMIIVNGRNHWPQDIEWAAEQIPGVRNGDIAAISVPGDNAEEVLMVLVHCGKRDPKERLAFADQVKRQILNTTGVACQIELVPPRTLPRTSSGKLSRSKARAQYIAGGITALAS